MNRNREQRVCFGSDSLSRSLPLVFSLNSVAGFGAGASSSALFVPLVPQEADSAVRLFAHTVRKSHCI